MSDLAVVLLGFGIGLVIVATFFWFERDALRRGLQQRRAELFGENGQIENVSDSPSPIQPDGEAEAFQHRRLGLAVCLIAFLGSAVLAIQTSDETLRIVHIALCATLAVGGGVLIFSRR